MALVVGDWPDKRKAFVGEPDMLGAMDHHARAYTNQLRRLLGF